MNIEEYKFEFAFDWIKLDQSTRLSTPESSFGEVTGIL